MTKQSFLDLIFPEASKTPFPPLAVTAQCALESGWGESEKCKFNNYLGIKYKPNRVTHFLGFARAGSFEYYSPEEAVPIEADWYTFSSIEQCMQGYVDFLSSSSRYAELFRVDSPETYIQVLGSTGYATDPAYTGKLLNILSDLKQLKLPDVNTSNTSIKEENTMSEIISPLAGEYIPSPNKNTPRDHKIDTITIHCMAGNTTAHNCGSIFAKESRKGSSNYGIDSQGRIACYVEEGSRAWTSNSKSNDMRAITIEVANDGGANTGWHVSDTALEALVSLLVDICQRNNIPRLLWRADKTLIGQVDKQNMTVHRWFAKKSCPGDYLYNKHSEIADRVNKILEGSSENAHIQGSNLSESDAAATSSVNTTNTRVDNLYRVRLSWSDIKSQIGAFSSLQSAKSACKTGYTVYNSSGQAVYTNQSDSPSSSQPSADYAGLYKVRKLDFSAKSQIGAFKSLERATKLADSNKGYGVFTEAGSLVYVSNDI